MKLEILESNIGTIRKRKGNYMKDEYLGQVVWFNPKKSYGFISWEGEEDMFVHFSDILCEGFRTLKKGQKVKFSIGTNNKGEPKAIEVLVIDEG